MGDQSKGTSPPVGSSAPATPPLEPASASPSASSLTTPSPLTLDDNRGSTLEGSLAAMPTASDPANHLLLPNAHEQGEQGGQGSLQRTERSGQNPMGPFPPLNTRASLAQMRGRPPLPPVGIPVPRLAPVVMQKTYKHGPGLERSPAATAPDSWYDHLRRPPAMPQTPKRAQPRYALSTREPHDNQHRARTPTPTLVAGAGRHQHEAFGLGIPPGIPPDLVEIPRFKKPQLNLAMLQRKSPAQRTAWYALWMSWVLHGLVSLFLDVNVMCVLVQCALRSPEQTTSTAYRAWRLALGVYIALWLVSVFAVWLGWEVGVEFWRKWRRARPAIEPIFFSAPASLHLSLLSFDHFAFLLHIRTSSWGTPYSRDIFPETAHALFQLLPGLMPLLPRAAIALVVLSTSWQPALATPTVHRDPTYFRPASTQFSGPARQYDGPSHGPSNDIDGPRPATRSEPVGVALSQLTRGLTTTTDALMSEVMSEGPDRVTGGTVPSLPLSQANTAIPGPEEYETASEGAWISSSTTASGRRPATPTTPAAADRQSSRAKSTSLGFLRHKASNAEDLIRKAKSVAVLSGSQDYQRLKQVAIGHERDGI
ncbi:hypothetical protein IAU60_000610 [Kwoniella sp. DSM 27419]